MSNELGIFLERLRNQKKLSLRDVKELTGLSHTYIRDLELGKNRQTQAPINPSLETLELLAKAYDFSLLDLLINAGYIDSKDEKDIAKRMQKLKYDLQYADGLMFSGEPLSDEANEILLEALEYSVHQAQRVNKKYIHDELKDKDNDDQGLG